MTSEEAMVKRLLKAHYDNPDKYAYLWEEIESGKKSITGVYKLLKESQRLEQIQFIKENKPPETWTNQERMLVNNLRIRPYTVWSHTLSDKEFMSSMLYFFKKPGDKVIGITKQYDDELAESCNILGREYHSEELK